LPDTIAAAHAAHYDHVAKIYPVSTFFFHSAGARLRLEAREIRNGMCVLELATGSGEMFRRLVTANPEGRTFGLDLFAEIWRRARSAAPGASFPMRNRIGARGRSQPGRFESASFDAVVCCYPFRAAFARTIFV